MRTYKQAPKDKKWVITEYGLEDSNVRRMIRDANPKDRYERSVPVSWFLKGYVELVDRR